MNKVVGVRGEVRKVRVVVGRNIGGFEKRWEKKVGDGLGVDVVCVVRGKIVNVRGIEYGEIGNGMLKKVIKGVGVKRGSVDWEMG